VFLLLQNGGGLGDPIWAPRAISSRNNCCLPEKFEYKAPIVKPASSAISSTEAPAKPLRANIERPRPAGAPGACPSLGSRQATLARLEVIVLHILDPTVIVIAIQDRVCDFARDSRGRHRGVSAATRLRPPLSTWVVRHE